MATSLVVHIPSERVPEHRWALECLLTSCLGLDVRFEIHDQSTIVISHGSAPGSITLPSDYLCNASAPWSPANMPTQVATRVQPGNIPWTMPDMETPIPIIFGSGDSIRFVDAHHLIIPWDIVGSAFFMLSRVEEYVSEEVDTHGRFPSHAALAVREGFHRRPVVQIWAEILWNAIHHLWPEQKRQHLPYRVLPSHDVDWPLSTFGLNVRQLARMVAGDAAKRRDPHTALRRLGAGIVPTKLKHHLDPAYTFDFIMAESERRDLTSAFFFIPENTAGFIDGTYSFDDEFVRILMTSVHKRSHEIGIHPGYDSYTNADRIKSGYDRLRSTTQQLGIEQATWGGRHHFLRWKATETWRHWDAAGLTYDSSVGYADDVGFRTGAAFPYRAFDLEQGRALDLLEYPLITMEASIVASVSDSYLGESDEEGLRIIGELAREIRRYGGNYTLLWHNSALVTSRQKSLYAATLDRITGS